MSTATMQRNKENFLDTTVSSSDLLEHWQGHRRLTRRVIELFPEDKLFNYSIGGMRPFAEMALEFIGMAEPGLDGVISGEWPSIDQIQHRKEKKPSFTKATLLDRWDEVTQKIEIEWPKISAERFRERDVAFGMWEGTIYGFILYWIDNEIHHRGQGYVYLRSLGIEPPPFWER
ncbi:MAG: damage-inducible protein DinB [Bacteroidetes bacterium]|nr:damage-inducible protein DinB [Bacteroidota bacterium]